MGQPPQTTANTTGPPAGAGQNARVPASFTLRAGGVLSPPNVSSPAFIAIRLTIQSLDARAHLVEIRTPLHHSLTVPAHGHATVQIPGQRQGNYAIAVDGITRGALVIGGEPGP